MIQFNLLPTVKLDFVQTRRTKRVVMFFSVLVGAGALAIMVMLFLYVQLQDKHSHDLSDDIKQQTSELKSIKDIDKILTIQNQLNSLDSLHGKKPVTSRLSGYIKQLTPAKVSIASLKVDFDLQTMDITGSADAISSVNKFADTLKFTNYKLGGETGSKSAFSSVVLANFGKDNKGTSYQLTLKFDPTIFANDGDVELQIPAGKITTRSQTEKPDSLFQPLSNPDKKEQ